MRYARIAYDGAIHHAAPHGPEHLLLPDGRAVGHRDVVWLPPIEPRTTFTLAINYADHAKELTFKAPEEPLGFMKAANSFIGHLGHTRRPKEAGFMHYECELAVIIGKQGRDITRAHAYDHVAGYTVANDYAIRDYLENWYRPNLRVKSRDTGTPLGPWFVSRHDIPDPMNLDIATFVNGRQVQSGNTRDMVFDIPELIVYFSSFMTLSPGDLILTGTPHGVANVVAGDEVHTEVSGVGRLVNTLIDDALLIDDSL